MDMDLRVPYAVYWHLYDAFAKNCFSLAAAGCRRFALIMWHEMRLTRFKRGGPALAGRCAGGSEYLSGRELKGKEIAGCPKWLPLKVSLLRSTLHGI